MASSDWTIISRVVVEYTRLVRQNDRKEPMYLMSVIRDPTWYIWASDWLKPNILVSANQKPEFTMCEFPFTDFTYNGSLRSFWRMKRVYTTTTREIIVQSLDAISKNSFKMA